MSDSSAPSVAGDAAPGDTRSRLIAAALRSFGQQGFAAAPVRAIAAEAGTNVASIAYHFGSKAGLYRACAERVVGLIDGAMVAGGPLSDGDPAADLSPEAATARLDGILRAMVDFLVTAPAAEAMVGFVLREMADQGAALDLIYDRLVEPRHRALCALWSAATGRPADSEAVRLAVFALIGQVVYFRIAQPLVRRRMGWTRIGPDEAARIADSLAAGLAAELERQRR